MIENSPFELSCLKCRGTIGWEDNRARCQNCKTEYPFTDGIWRFLPQKRAQHFAKFLEQYAAIRREEGWGSDHAEYYRRLPLVPRSDPLRNIWRIREKNFNRLLQLIGDTQPLKILDSGAGNGWLSNQLALRGHCVAALDLSDDERDGLGAWINYAVRFDCFQTEFDRLPFRTAQFDLLIFNASLHYSSMLTTTLHEAKRALATTGKIIVLDSPFYVNAASGEALAREQKTRLGRKNHSAIMGYLTLTDLDVAAKKTGLRMKVWSADREWHKRLRRMLLEKRLGREPAHFPVVVLENCEI